MIRPRPNLPPHLGIVLSLAAVLAGCSDGGTRPTASAPAAPPLPPPAPVECRFTESPPTIDGVLDDAAWKDAATIENFSMPWLARDASGEPRKPAKATRAKILWDCDHLYVSADLDDADLYADVVEHDGQIWDNDVFEVFLKPSVEKPAYYEFQVNAKNTQFDCFMPRRGHVGRFKKLHEFGIESAVKLRGTIDTWNDTDEGWSVELRIPWASFSHTGGRPKPGDEWRFALCRYDYDVSREQPELSTSAPLSKLSFHLHENYAPLTFTGPAGPAADGSAAPDLCR